MGRVVVDTDVASFVFKNDSRAVLYERDLVDNELLISFQTLAELYRWPVVRNWGERRRLRLFEFIREKFAIHPYDDAFCETWAEVSAAAERSAFGGGGAESAR